MYWRQGVSGGAYPKRVTTTRPVLVVDLGANTAQTIARRVREEHVYSQIVPPAETSVLLESEPLAVIYAGGEGALPAATAADVRSTGVPVLECDGLPDRAAIQGFLTGAGAPQEWTAAHIVEDQVRAIRAQVGDAKVICGLSGGVDSSVAAALVQRAVGDQLTCVFVDHGLLRKGEAAQVREDFVDATGITLKFVDAEDAFLDALTGVTDPEEKRKIIGREFIRAFERAARELVAEGEDVKFLVQGTLYPDVVESIAADGKVSVKSHHNVGGLPDDLQFDLVEPLRELFKDEVREIGLELGVPDAIVWRQPFPGPGLGVRIVGELTRDNLAVLREADAIVREELSSAGLDREIWQCPVVLLADVRSVGVTDGARTYGHPIVLRPVASEDAMSADWYRLPYDLLARISERITTEVAKVNRVILDITNKPPGTIEWE